ncbi:MAG: zinc ribbon domain-containing protein [Chloroflexi bacterium]|nr:zinc ribbon domain-containing protein [Chloroflexota bacterium]
MMYCSKCGAQVAPGSRFCSGCGASIADGAGLHTQQGARLPRKDPAVAALLASLPGLFGLLGIGHIYVGQTGKGVAWLIAGIILVFLGFVFAITIIGLLIAIPIWIAGFIIWIVLIFGAHSAARKFNDAVQRTGQAPW